MDEYQRACVYTLFYNVLPKLFHENFQNNHMQSINDIYSKEQLTWDARLDLFKDYLFKVLEETPHHLTLYPYHYKSVYIRWFDKIKQDFLNEYYYKKKTPPWKDETEWFIYEVVREIISYKDLTNAIRIMETKNVSFEERVKKFKAFVFGLYDTYNHDYFLQFKGEKGWKPIEDFIDSKIKTKKDGGSH